MNTDTTIKYPHFYVDLNANCAYIYITGNVQVASTEEITSTINADYDAAGNVIGIEFLSVNIDFGEQFRVRKS